MTYSLYVIQLDPKCWDEQPKLRRMNPHIPKHKQPKACAYVGTSSKPQQRVQQHIRGKKRSTRIVHMYYQGATYPPPKVDRWDDAVQLERETVKNLQRLGYATWSGN